MDKGNGGCQTGKTDSGIRWCLPHVTTRKQRESVSGFGGKGNMGFNDMILLLGKVHSDRTPFLLLRTRYLNRFGRSKALYHLLEPMVR